MQYQRIIVATGKPVGDPDDLPDDLQGMDDASLANLDAVLIFPDPRYRGAGYVPYIAPADAPQPKWMAAFIAVGVLTPKQAQDAANYMAAHP